MDLAAHVHPTKPPSETPFPLPTVLSWCFRAHDRRSIGVFAFMLRVLGVSPCMGLHGAWGEPLESPEASNRRYLGHRRRTRATHDMRGLVTWRVWRGKDHVPLGVSYDVKRAWVLTGWILGPDCS